MESPTGIYMLFCMTFATVQQQLTTPEGFSKALDVRSAPIGLFWSLILITVLAVGINLFQLGSATDWDWYLMGRYFLDPDAVQFEGYRAGRSEAFRFFAVYAPLVALPLAVIALIVHLSTRGKTGRKRFEAFQQRGWVARQRFTGLRVKSGNQQADTVLLSHPSMPDEAFDAAVFQYASENAALDKKAKKAAARAAVKAGVIQGVSAARLTPTLPGELIIALARGKSEYVVVIPPEPGTNSKIEILPLKL